MRSAFFGTRRVARDRRLPGLASHDVRPQARVHPEGPQGEDAGPARRETVRLLDQCPGRAQVEDLCVVVGIHVSSQEPGRGDAHGPPLVGVAHGGLSPNSRPPAEKFTPFHRRVITGRCGRQSGSEGFRGLSASIGCHEGRPWRPGWSVRVEGPQPPHHPAQVSIQGPRHGRGHVPELQA